MALTISRVANADYVVSNKKVKVRDITFDASYVTGGLSLTPADVGLKVIQQAVPHGLAKPATTTTAIEVSYDYTNSKLVAYWGNAGTASVIPEVTNATSLATQVVRITFIGY